MPRLTKQNKAAITQKYNNIGKGSTQPKGMEYKIKEHEHQFITPVKSQILDLPYKYIIWLGAKYGGKTRPVVTRMNGMMLEDESIYGLALKKYKTNAATRLHTAISNMGREIRMSGYKVPLLVKGVSNTYLMKDMRVRELNQTIEYASLDDMDGIAGIEAPNLGRFGIVHIEEPVMKGDKEQPTSEDFWETIKILESSVDRSNTRYAEINNEDPMFPAYHFTMNAWDDHPLVTEAEAAFPENEFLNWCLGVDDWTRISIDEVNAKWEDIKKSLQENNTSVRTVGEESKAFVRLTLFANPGWSSTSIVYNPRLEFTKEEQVERFWDLIKTAIMQKDYSSLAIYLGLKRQESADNKTYDLSLLETGDTLKTIKEEDWEIIGSSQGWDIDINRLFCGTPVVLGRKMNFDTLEIIHKLFVLPQSTFPAYGDGGGRNIPLYKETIKNKATDIYNTVTVLGNPKEPLSLGRYLYLDDDKSMWLSYFLGDPRWSMAKAKKHADWEIIPRQTWLNMAINAGFIMIDSSNTTLLTNLGRSTLTDGTDKRDESGSLNKLYDEINSMEYAIYPFRGFLYQEIIK